MKVAQYRLGRELTAPEMEMVIPDILITWHEAPAITEGNADEFLRDRMTIAAAEMDSLIKFHNIVDHRHQTPEAEFITVVNRAINDINHIIQADWPYRSNKSLLRWPSPFYEDWLGIK